MSNGRQNVWGLEGGGLRYTKTQNWLEELGLSTKGEDHPWAEL